MWNWLYLNDERGIFQVHSEVNIFNPLPFVSFLSQYGPIQVFHYLNGSIIGISYSKYACIKTYQCNYSIDIQKQFGMKKRELIIIIITKLNVITQVDVCKRQVVLRIEYIYVNLVRSFVFFFENTSVVNVITKFHVDGSCTPSALVPCYDDHQGEIHRSLPPPAVF